MFTTFYVFRYKIWMNRKSVFMVVLSLHLKIHFFCVCRQLLFRVSVHEYTFVMYVRAFFCSNCNDNRELMLKQLGGIAYSCNLTTQPTNLLLLCFRCHFIVTFFILLIFSFAFLIWFVCVCFCFESNLFL